MDFSNESSMISKLFAESIFPSGSKILIAIMGIPISKIWPEISKISPVWKLLLLKPTSKESANTGVEKINDIVKIASMIPMKYLNKSKNRIFLYNTHVEKILVIQQ